jgi:hypothetical protein
MPRNEAEGGQRHFDEAREALAGKRYALDRVSSKVLRFMLEQPEGCDATLCAQRFEIRFGWNPSRHPYFSGTAPRIISWLLDLANAPPGQSLLQSVIGPGDVPAVEGAAGEMAFPAWSFGLRRVWLESSPTMVRLWIRSAASGDPAERHLPAPLPEPIGYAHRTVALPDSLLCPHCGASSRVYRQLHGDRLVCGVCARSFAMPAG